MAGEFEQLVKSYEPVIVGTFMKQSVLEIPPNQRPYEWSVDNWTDLWDDLIETIDEALERPIDPFYAYHFFGPMFFVKPPQSDDLRVLDGQQRLATFQVVLSVVSDIARYFRYMSRLSAAGEDLPGRIYDFLFVTRKGIRQPRLSLGDDNRAFFERILIPVQSGPSVQTIPTLKIVQLREDSKSNSSNELLFKSYRFFLEEIAKFLAKEYEIELPPGRLVPDKMSELLLHDPARCERLLNTIFENITERFYVLRAIIPSPDIMYQMFETLNQRGEKLAVSDLFKNLLFDRFYKKLGEDKIQAMWGELMASVENNIGDFLRHFWLSNFKFVRTAKLFRAIREKIDAFDDISQFEAFMKQMTIEARIYAALKDPSNDRWKTKEKLVQLLDELKYLGFKQGYPLLLSVYVKLGPLESEQFASFVRSYLNFVVRSYTIMGGNPNELEEQYSEWAREIRRKKISIQEVIDSIREVSPNNDDVADAIVGMNGVSPRIGRYILVKINDSLTKSPLNWIWRNNPTVEHVIPQTPEDWWIAFLRDRKLKHKALVGRLGNLTILSSKENTELGNMPYPEKRGKYLSMSLPINEKTFVSDAFNEFDEKAITKREKIFAQAVRENGLWS